MPVPLQSGHVTFFSAPVGFKNVEMLSPVFDTSSLAGEIVVMTFIFPVPLQSGQGLGLPPHVMQVCVTDLGSP